MVLDLSCVIHKVVGLLLGAYAEVDARDKQQRTPLHLCSETGHQAVVKVSDQDAVNSMLVQVVERFLRGKDVPYCCDVLAQFPE